MTVPSVPSLFVDCSRPPTTTGVFTVYVSPSRCAYETKLSRTKSLHSTVPRRHILDSDHVVNYDHIELEVPFFKDFLNYLDIIAVLPTFIMVRCRSTLLLLWLCLFLVGCPFIPLLTSRFFVVLIVLGTHQKQASDLFQPQGPPTKFTTLEIMVNFLKVTRAIRLYKIFRAHSGTKILWKTIQGSSRPILVILPVR